MSAACGAGAYSYAGIAGWHPTRGVAATVEPKAAPQVEHGHVAAWVGVGGVGLGPGGSNEWLQVGIASEGTGSGLYYEVARPHAAPQYRDLGVVVDVSARHRVAVIEMERRPGWWRVWVDRSPVSQPIFLPGSHDRWQPVVTSESWNGGVPSCNGFVYQFSSIRTRQGGWRMLSDVYLVETPGYAVEWRQATMIAVGGLGGGLPAGAAARQPLVLSK